MTLTYKHEVDMVELNQRAKYLCVKCRFIFDISHSNTRTADPLQYFGSQTGR